MLKRLFIALLLLLLTPFCLHAKEVGESSLFSGKWSLILDGMYQPTFRIIITSDRHQIVYPKKMYYGFGISKNHLRLEYFNYLKKPKVSVSWDFFPSAVGTPYVSYVYGRGTTFSNKSSTTLKQKMMSDIAVGLSFQPIQFANIYAEYLVAENFFLIGARFKLSLTFK